jgi:hypothetical protein
MAVNGPRMMRVESSVFDNEAKYSKERGENRCTEVGE